MRLGVNLKALRILNTVVLLFLFCHLLACTFYAMARESEGHADKTWLSAYDGGYLVDGFTHTFDAYGTALFWAIGIVCALGTYSHTHTLYTRTPPSSLPWRLQGPQRPLTAPAACQPACRVARLRVS